jgi:hypothetical protein
MKACPAQVGDFFELFAEQNLLMALSTCPGGDLSVPMWGDGAHDPVEVCRPIGVEVYEVDSELLRAHQWRPPLLPEYAGAHGLRAASWA